jgi:hypothetical protein
MNGPGCIVKCVCTFIQDLEEFRKWTQNYLRKYLYTL